MKENNHDLGSLTYLSDLSITEAIHISGLKVNNLLSYSKASTIVVNPCGIQTSITRPTTF